MAETCVKNGHAEKKLGRAVFEDCKVLSTMYVMLIRLVPIKQRHATFSTTRRRQFRLRFAHLVAQVSSR
jgi:hypothetical protein